MSWRELKDRAEILTDLARMLWARRAWALVPAALFLALILAFLAASEMPALLPFFYAVF